MELINSFLVVFLVDEVHDNRWGCQEEEEDEDA